MNKITRGENTFHWLVLQHQRIVCVWCFRVATWIFSAEFHMKVVRHDFHKYNQGFNSKIINRT